MISRILAAAAEEGATAPNPLIPAWYDITWSSVVFVVLLTFFWFKVLPGFKKMLDERAKAIEGRLAEAEAAQRSAEERTAFIEAEQAKLREIVLNERLDKTFELSFFLMSADSPDGAEGADGDVSDEALGDAAAAPESSIPEYVSVEVAPT